MDRCRRTPPAEGSPPARTTPDRDRDQDQDRDQDRDREMPDGDQQPPLVVPWRWSLVLPVKGGPRAKTRLASLGAGRAAVAAALARDSVAATVACSRVAAVIVVTSDAAAGAMANELGACVVADPGTGLDRAVDAGLRAADRRTACAVLLADVPAMRPTDLAAGLDACARAIAQGAASAIVPDLDGDGTVLLAAGHPAGVLPRFGAGSAARHSVDGTLVADVPARLRRDVDHPAHLAVALSLGVGPATARAAAELGLALPAPA